MGTSYELPKGNDDGVSVYLLSEIPDYGFIKQCPTGCVHMTYRSVTLHFPSIETLACVAGCWRKVLKQAEPGDVMELGYGPLRLLVATHEAVALERMMSEAVQQVENAPQESECLSGAVNEWLDWPEGDVAIPIPAQFSVLPHTFGDGHASG